MRIQTGTRRTIWLLFLTVIVLCMTGLAAVYLVDSVRDADERREEYYRAQSDLSDARRNMQELQVLVDMHKEMPDAFKEYVARKCGYVGDGEIIFGVKGN